MRYNVVSCSMWYIIRLTLWLSHFLVILTFWCFLAHRITILEILPRDRKSYLTHAPRGGGWGGTLIFLFIRRLGFFSFFFWGGGQKNEKENWGLTILWIFFGSSQIGLYLGVIYMHLRIFS